MGYAPPPHAPAPYSPAPYPPAEQAFTPPAAPAPDEGQTTAPVPRVRAAHQELLPKALANLAMRDLTLVESLLLLIQRLEDREDDPDLLEILYKVDHLGTRMRRNCENLLVMAGEPIAAGHQAPVPLHDVTRAALSEIDKYTRVRIQELPQLHIRDIAADDISHLLAELLENALANSSDDSDVTVRGRYRDDGGLVLEIADDGIGIPPDKLTRLNAELCESPVLTDETLRHMGLFVVGLLAHRHGIEVQLQTRPFSGTSAFVYIPTEIARVSRNSSAQSGSGESMPETNDSAGTPAPQAHAGPQPPATARRPGAPDRAEQPLPELPKRDPGRGTPGLRVVEGEAHSAAPDRDRPQPEAYELPELPRRQPAGGQEQGTDGSAALPRRIPRGGGPPDPAGEADGDGQQDDFVAVRGTPPKEGAAPGPEGETLSYAERIRAEFDGYVSGRREYQEHADASEVRSDSAGEDSGEGPGQHTADGGRESTPDEAEEGAAPHSPTPGKAEQP